MRQGVLRDRGPDRDVRPDDDAQLDLVIQQGDLGGLADRVVGAADGGRRFPEERGVQRCRVGSDVQRVRPVVEQLSHDAARCGDRREDVEIRRDGVLAVCALDGRTIGEQITGGVGRGVDAGRGLTVQAPPSSAVRTMFTGMVIRFLEKGSQGTERDGLLVRHDRPARPGPGLPPPQLLRRLAVAQSAQQVVGIDVHADRIAGELVAVEERRGVIRVEVLHLELESDAVRILVVEEMVGPWLMDQTGRMPWRFNRT